MKNILRKTTPAFIWRALVAVKYYIIDAFQWAIRQDSALVPPRKFRAYVGHGEFVAIGHEFLEYFKVNGLKPSDRVLDVGCGIGRMAIPLTNYLSDGSYDGFDIVPHGITWCQEKVTSLFPNFRFQHADIWNKMYNPNGKLNVSEFTFPYPDATFDFAFLTSVFTHMLYCDIKHYLSELSRVLKPNGRCLITWFLLTDESVALIKSGQSSRNFDHYIDGGMTIDPNVPEDAIAFKESDVRALYAEYGIRVDKIEYGSWCGRIHYLSYQDICIGSKY